MTFVRSIFPRPCWSVGPAHPASATKRCGQPQKSGSVSLAMRGMNISGERRCVPFVVCPTPTSVRCKVIRKVAWFPAWASTGGKWGTSSASSSSSSGSAATSSSIGTMIAATFGAALTPRLVKMFSTSSPAASRAVFSSARAAFSSGTFFAAVRRARSAASSGKHSPSTAVLHVSRLSVTAERIS